MDVLGKTNDDIGGVADADDAASRNKDAASEPESKPKPKPKSSAKPKPKSAPIPKPESKPKPNFKPKLKPEPEPESEPEPEFKSEPKPEPESKLDSAPKLKPLKTRQHSDSAETHLYVVTSPEMRAVDKYKLGFTSQTRAGLTTRYITALNEVEIMLFMPGTLDEEQYLHSQLGNDRISNVRGNASEWYIMPLRTLLGRIMFLLEQYEKERNYTSGEHVHKSEYVGPSKFLQAARTGRWDLFREWLVSREYRQDRHRRPKLKRAPDLVRALIQWNEAHHWLECLELMCSSDTAPIELLETFIRYCEDRWVRDGEWIMYSRAVELGRDAAQRAGRSQTVEYLTQSWLAGSAADIKNDSGVNPNVTDAEVELVSGQNDSTKGTKQLAQRDGKASSKANNHSSDPGSESPNLVVSNVSGITLTLQKLQSRQTWSTEIIADAIGRIAVLLRDHDEKNLIPAVAGLLQYGDPAALATLQHMLGGEIEIIATVGVYAAHRSWHEAIPKVIDLGVSLSQCARLAAAIGDEEALTTLVMQYGCAWSLTCREAVLHYVYRGSRKMIELLRRNGVVNWGAGLITAAEFGSVELLREFWDNAKPSQRREAFNRGLAGNRESVVVWFLDHGIEEKTTEPSVRVVKLGAGLNLGVVTQIDMTAATASGSDPLRSAALSKRSGFSGDRYS